MSVITKFNTSNLQKFLNEIDRYYIGGDEWIKRMYNASYNDTNYPPYNVIRENDNEIKLEVAVAGFKSNDINVYTEDGKLVIECNKEVNNNKEYVYHGLATRAFKRQWTISDDMEVKSVNHEDGVLMVLLEKVIPENKKKKVWF
jgi:molecular chaperone IbpA